MCAEGLRDLERRGRDAAADAPYEHPLAFTEAGLRHEHPVGRLEHEREGGRLLERDVVGKEIDVRGRHGDQLGVRPVGVLADHGHAAVVHDAGVDDDALPGLEALDALAQILDDACAVRAEDPRLRHGRQALAHPHVQVIQRCGAQPDQHLAGGGRRIRDVLVAQHLGTAVLVDANRLHARVSDLDAQAGEPEL